MINRQVHQGFPCASIRLIISLDVEMALLLHLGLRSVNDHRSVLRSCAPNTCSVAGHSLVFIFVHQMWHQEPLLHNSDFAKVCHHDIISTLAV